MTHPTRQRRNPSYRIPNLVVATRVALAFAAVGLMTRATPTLVAGGAVLIGVVLAMDALDGFAARRLGVASRFGAVLDITADRIVEHVFWIFFAVAQVVGLWAPLVVMTRSFLVDTARSLALAHGRTAFGRETMMHSPLTRFLTGSRSMRNAYGATKAAAFILLGLVLAASAASAGGTVSTTVSSGGFLGTTGASTLAVSARLAAAAAVALCVLRGVPVLWDSRAYLFERTRPAGSGGEAAQ